MNELDEEDLNDDFIWQYWGKSYDEKNITRWRLALAYEPK